LQEGKIHKCSSAFIAFPIPKFTTID